MNHNPNFLSILDRHGHLSMMSSHRLVSHIAHLLHEHFNNSENSTEVIVNKMDEFTLIEDYLSL